VSQTSAAIEARDGRLPPVIGVSSGGCFHPLDPRQDEIHVEDIAHHLANICRYTGATSGFWSVAAHCVEVSHRLQPYGREVALIGLLHDASEAYLVDVPRPLKPDFAGYAAWEARLEAAISTRFALHYPWPAVVKTVDSEMVYDEVANFFPAGSFMWQRYGITQRRSNLRPLYPPEGRAAFLARYLELR
jgi:hypothetical protein